MYPEGTLLLVDNQPVYLIQNGLKRWITNQQTLIALGYANTAKIPVTSAQVAIIPRGADINVPSDLAPPSLPVVTPPGAPGANPIWPTFTSNPFGTPSTPGSSGSLSRPTTYFGVTLPLWGWGAAAFGGYYMFGRRRR